MAIREETGGKKDLTAGPVNGLIMTMMLFSLGLGLRWAEVLDEAAAGALAKYVVKVSMPALLLKTFLNMHIEALSSLLIVLGSIMAYALLCGLLPATYMFADAPSEIKGLLYCCSMGWNIGLFAFPMVKLLYGEDSKEFLDIALFDIPNVLVNFGLSYAVVLSMAPIDQYLPLADGPTTPREAIVKSDSSMAQRFCALPAAHRLMMLKKILAYPPLFWGVLGLSLNVSGFDPHVVPPAVYSALSCVGETTTTVPLIAMGLLTDLSALRFDKVRILAKLLALRVVPTLLIGAWVMFGNVEQDASMARSMLVGLIMPVPFVAIPYANELGYDKTFAASAVVASTLVSFCLVVLHVYLLPA
jgi:predicted permease